MKRFLFCILFIFTLAAPAQKKDFAYLDFKKADAIASKYKGEGLHNLPILVTKLTAQLHTDAERFRVIYYWICHNIEGDYKLTAENKRSYKKLKKTEDILSWNEDFRKRTFKTLLEEKRTLCSGYSLLLKEMANLAGIECEIINGYSHINKPRKKNKALPDHSWNAVNLDGKWYLCDATWSSGIIDMDTYIFKFKYDDSFFLMEPSLFSETHTPLQKQWMLLEGKAEIASRNLTKSVNFSKNPPLY